jgi:hypothetical protein
MTSLSRTTRSVPSPALVTPEGERKIAARIQAIDKLLLSGLLEPKLEKALKTERTRLQKVLLTGVISGTSGLLAPGVEKKIQQRIKESTGRCSQGPSHCSWRRSSPKSVLSW